MGIGTSVVGRFVRKRKDMGKRDRRCACSDNNADRDNKLTSWPTVRKWWGRPPDENEALPARHSHIIVTLE